MKPSACILWLFLLVLAYVGGLCTEFARTQSRVSSRDSANSWSVEVLRTTDARGMTYSSLHQATIAPEVTGSSMRWTDELGQRWIFIDGALAHELKSDLPDPRAGR